MRQNFPSSAGASYGCRLSTIAFCTLITCFSTYCAADASVSSETLARYLNEGDYSAVVQALNASPQKTPEQYNMLISALMEQDLDDAEDAAQDFIDAYSNDYRAYHTHASVMGAQASSSIFSALSYAKKAKVSLQKAVKIAPDNIAVYKALLKFHLMAPSIAGGDKERARSLVEQISSMDATEGQFALADFYSSEDDEKAAEKILLALSQQDETRIRGVFSLGSMYLLDDKFDQAVSTLEPLLYEEVAPITDEASSEWKKYESDVQSLMFGKYRIGLAAVKSKQHTQIGVQALNAYLTQLNDTTIDTSDLPNKSWANLRLAELLLNLDMVDEANEALAQIKRKKDKRLDALLAKLEKQIKKRA